MHDSFPDLRTGKPKTRPLAKLLLTRREAAAVLSMSERTLQTLTNNGTIPCIRLSPQLIRYAPESLERWIRAQERNTSEAPMDLARSPE